jgi:hypothetical protein
VTVAPRCKIVAFGDTEIEVLVMQIIRIKIETFLLKIAQTRETEASCDECARASAQLAEMLAVAQVTDEELLVILHHLQECIPCAQEFEALCNCERMEREENWPPLEEMWAHLQNDG